MHHMLATLKNQWFYLITTIKVHLARQMKMIMERSIEKTDSVYWKNKNR